VVGESTLTVIKDSAQRACAGSMVSGVPSRTNSGSFGEMGAPDWRAGEGMGDPKNEDPMGNMQPRGGAEFGVYLKCPMFNELIGGKACVMKRSVSFWQWG
jgi:hypothetical protein